MIRTNWPSFPQYHYDDICHDNEVRSRAAKARGSHRQHQQNASKLTKWSTHNAGHTLVKTKSAMFFRSDTGRPVLNAFVKLKAVSREIYVVAANIATATNEKG